MDFVKTAQNIAFQAHRGHYRKDGVVPYINHPRRVVERVKGDPEAEATAWLHDSLEDSDLTADDLREGGIPEKVIEAVELLTKPEDLSYQDYMHIVKTNSLATKVKIQDMLDNLSDDPSDSQILKYSKAFLVLLDN